MRWNVRQSTISRRFHKLPPPPLPLLHTKLYPASLGSRGCRACQNTTPHVEVISSPGRDFPSLGLQREEVSTGPGLPTSGLQVSHLHNVGVPVDIPTLQTHPTKLVLAHVDWIVLFIGRVLRVF